MAEAQMKHIRLSKTWATYSHTFENVADAEIFIAFIGGNASFLNTLSIDSITVAYGTLPAATFPMVEDFAKFTAGSVETPDATKLDNAMMQIPYWMTNQAPWGALNVFQAGQTAYVKANGRLTMPSVTYTAGKYDYIRFSLKVKLQTSSYYHPKHFIIQGSNNASDTNSFVNLKEVRTTWSSYETKEFAFENTTEYRCYRINVKESTSSYTVFYTVNFGFFLPN